MKSTAILTLLHAIRQIQVGTEVREVVRTCSIPSKGGAQEDTYLARRGGLHVDPLFAYIIRVIVN